MNSICRDFLHGSGDRQRSSGSGMSQGPISILAFICVPITLQRRPLLILLFKLTVTSLW